MMFTKPPNTINTTLTLPTNLLSTLNTTLVVPTNLPSTINNTFTLPTNLPSTINTTLIVPIDLAYYYGFDNDDDEIININGKQFKEIELECLLEGFNI